MFMADIRRMVKFVESCFSSMKFDRLSIQIQERCRCCEVARMSRGSNARLVLPLKTSRIIWSEPQLPSELSFPIARPTPHVSQASASSLEQQQQR